MTLVVRELSEATFQSMSTDWNMCLQRSDSDPLFMSWAWMFTWWETWSQVLGLNLCLIGVYLADGHLVGIAPFYHRQVKTPIGLRLNRLHFMGNAWRLAPTVRTEYCGLILDEEFKAEACIAICEYLMEKDWDELMLCDVVSNLIKESGNSSFCMDGRLNWITRSSSIGMRIDTTIAHSEWLASLGKHTRLKLHNRRAYLDRKGSVALIYAQTDQEINDFFFNLNEFHKKRWGKRAFDREALRFHKNLIERLNGAIEPRCSSLMLNGKCISVLYDLHSSHGRYNLQSGYAEQFDRKLSLGTLHLGYAIEEAFATPTCNFYDLLAGDGKRSNYKRHFNGREVHFQTYQVARNQILKVMYGLRLKLPISVRQPLNRFLRL